jgi:GNAT superfamily N-acetyltransferase
VLATDPSLRFLSTVSGVTQDTVAAAIGLVDEPVWDGVTPSLIASTEPSAAIVAALSTAGLVRAPDRLVAIAALPAERASPPEPRPHIVEVRGSDAFLPVLLAGYEVDGTVAAFIGAEHQLPTMRRFLLVDRGEPIAAAAMTIHGDIAVLGGASTLPSHRGRGAQLHLLQHRLQTAAAAGCTSAVATARAESASAVNLGRAGFRIHRHSAWMTSPE